MLVTSILSLSHSVFKSFLFQSRLELGLCGKKVKLELSQSATYPHTAPCNRTGAFYKTQEDHDGPISLT